jgi:hypothetical protein
MDASADSVASCQPIASSMLRWYWSLASSVWRRPIARAVLNGSSEGRVISLPEDALLWVRAIFSDSALRSERTLRWIIEVVIRMTRAPLGRYG